MSSIRAHTSEIIVTLLTLDKPSALSFMFGGCCIVKEAMYTHVWRVQLSFYRNVQLHYAYL